MNVRYVPQGKNQCGQACVSVLLDGISLDESASLIGRKTYTRAKDLDRGLRKGSKGKMRLGPRRSGGPPLNGGFGVWLVAVKIRPGRNWHWALLRLNGLDVEMVWPTMYPQHILGYSATERTSDSYNTAWSSRWKITQSYRIEGLRREFKHERHSRANE